MRRLHNEIIKVFSFIDCAVEDDSSTHPNQLKFKGVLTMLDEPSSKPPNGSRGHRIIIKSATARKLLNTLIDMGINYKPSLDAHNPQQKVGVIQKAWIKGSELWISGIIWRRDFPDAEKALSKNNLGMSFEAADIEVEDTKADVWNLVDFHFTGATILYKNAAAYSKTSASLLASIAASAENVDQIYGGAFMKNLKNKKKGAEKNISAADGTRAQLRLIAAGQEAMSKTSKKNFTLLAQAITTLAKSQDKLTRTLQASMQQDDQEDEIDASGDDEGGDDNESEDEIDASGDEEDDVEASKKSKKDDSDDDSDDEDDADDVDAKGSDDEDEFDDLNDEGEIDEDEVPGSVNKGIQKNKGHKTTTTPMKTKSKSMPIAASTNARLVEHNARLMAANDKLRRRLKKTNSETAAKLEAAANNTDRRSSTIAADVTRLLKKGGLEVEAIAASGEKISAEEVDAALDAAQIMDITQRMAVKTQLSKSNMID